MPFLVRVALCWLVAAVGFLAACVVIGAREWVYAVASVCVLVTAVCLRVLWVHEPIRLQLQAVGPNGWTCHVCGDYRPDALISVYQRSSQLGGVSMTENVRYCNDRPLCRAGAELVRFSSVSAST